MRPITHLRLLKKDWSQNKNNCQCAVYTSQWVIIQPLKRTAICDMVESEGHYMLNEIKPTKTNIARCYLHVESQKKKKRQTLRNGIKWGFPVPEGWGKQGEVGKRAQTCSCKMSKS